MSYDSTEDTVNHIHRVQELLHEVSRNLYTRGLVHDRSKLKEPEKSAFDNAKSKLNKLTYGSDEYTAALKELGTSLDHHYKNNSHHPQHYENGIAGMSLLDLIEMFADWKAATERMADGSIQRSIEINRDRFNIDPQLVQIFKNTAAEMGWNK